MGLVQSRETRCFQRADSPPNTSGYIKSDPSTTRIRIAPERKALCKCIFTACSVRISEDEALIHSSAAGTPHCRRVFMRWPFSVPVALEPSENVPPLEMTDSEAGGQPGTSLHGNRKDHSPVPDKVTPLGCQTGGCSGRQQPDHIAQLLPSLPRGTLGFVVCGVSTLPL